VARKLALREVEINRIEPEGWLRRFLEIQRDGLTGHLEHAKFPFDTGGWNRTNVKHRGGCAWWPYEQTGYWFDGMIRCAYLLKDPWLLAKALKPVDFVLGNPDKDGYLGPAFMKGPKGWLRWSHAVFFRAIMAHYSATGDRSILERLTRHYLSNTAPHTDGRDVCNVEIMCWLYEQTGDKRLLRGAEKAFAGWNQLNPKHDCHVDNLLSARRAREHGVTYNEMSKLGAILSMCTGDKRLLKASVNAYRKIDRHHLLIDGVNSSTEGLKGKDPLDSHETCDIADYTWSVGYLLMATGSAAYADKIERACFNAAPGAVTSDFKALQYFSCPNQVVADASSNHNYFFRGHKWMSYRPNPGTECCPGEVNRILPNYAARMWMRSGGNGLAAVLYGPGRVTTQVGAGKGREVTVVETTDYPFGERVDFEFRLAAPASFPFTVRIPGWCRKASLRVNGKVWKGSRLKAGFFVTIDRTFAPNDRIALLLPMELKLSRWPRGGVGIERGPLVYALRIEEDWRVDATDEKSSKEFPAWNLYPASDWNYALALNGRKLTDHVEVVRKPLTPEAWNIRAAPIELRVPARRVRGWKLVKTKTVMAEYFRDGKLVHERLRENFVLTPQLPDPATLRKRLASKVERVTLVPYGCTKLRIAVFPHAK